MVQIPPAAFALAALALAGAAIPAQAQRDSTLLRSTRVVVTISNDPTAMYNGVYQAQSISTKCGLADYSYPHRANSFAVMFPDDGTVPLQVTSVNFDADTLAAGTTRTSFYLSVSIRVGATGTPPAYVVRANKPQFNEPGTAQLIRLPNGVDSLNVIGTATKGTKVGVEMMLVCQPAP
jgi:hypothetical protein